MGCPRARVGSLRVVALLRQAPQEWKPPVVQASPLPGNWRAGSSPLWGQGRTLSPCCCQEPGTCGLTACWGSTLGNLCGIVQRKDGYEPSSLPVLQANLPPFPLRPRSDCLQRSGLPAKAAGGVSSAAASRLILRVVTANSNGASSTPSTCTRTEQSNSDPQSDHPGQHRRILPCYWSV